MCVEASPTISSRYLSTSRTSSGSFPPSEVVGPLGDGPRVSRFGLGPAGSRRGNPATRRSPTSPDPRPGSRVGPRLRRTRRRHVPRYTCPHEGFFNRSLSDHHLEPVLPWETLPRGI
ncbi:hypothetical protein CRENBAI_022902 [Crenichthys baileyi]|uniref:Uncharacterized protein n=1 Tax=Crenichthys baileyi TaxID=28760 RepID=A0AAV9R0V6_9TELE